MGCVLMLACAVFAEAGLLLTFCAMPFSRLFQKIQLVNDVLMLAEDITPPSKAALLPKKVLFVTVNVAPGELQIAPPTIDA